MEAFKQKSVEISFRKFNDYASDVIHSDYNTFDTRFNIFIHHCETDPIMKIITSQLKQMDVNFQQWWSEGHQTMGSMIGSAQFSLPLDETLRDALLYQLLLKIQSGEIKFVTFCMDFFGETNYNLLINSFNRAVFKPLVRSIGYKLEEISDSIATELQIKQEVPINMFYVYNDYTVTMGSDNEFGGDAVIGGGAAFVKKEEK
jgi:hypothetical protein